MCGFAFAFDFEHNGRVNSIIMHKMIDELTHRGPDDEGVAIF